MPYSALMSLEDRDDQRIRLVSGHFHEAGRDDLASFVVLEMAKVLHLEKAARV